MFKSKSIFSRMFFSYSLIIVLSLLLFIGVFFYLFHLNMYNEYEEIYAHHHTQIETQVQDLTDTAGSGDATGEILAYSLDQPGYHIYITDAEGRQIFGPDPEASSVPVPVPDDILDRAAAGEAVSGGGFQEGGLRYTAASLLDADMEAADQPVMVMIFYDLTHEYRQFIWMIFLTFFIALVFAVPILWFLSKRITAPLREMSETARRFAKGDFSKSVQYKRNDEIGQLAKSFNYMADELDDLETARRQYISNVSHELRSPLTSIKGFITALMDGTIPVDRQDRYHRLMKAETERMIKLVNDTLDMNQLDEHHPKLTRTDYDLTAQIRTIIHKMEPHCNAKQLEIHLHAKDGRRVNADRERMEQVFANLLHNAIQFSKTGSGVDVTLTGKGRHVEVRIQDYGIGMAAGELDLIWRRFYKVDEARSNKSGAGLGLAIVKSILELHGTEIEVYSTPGEGTVFIFNLPSA